jgi:hypothetical protein
MNDLLAFLRRLDDAGISHTLAHNRDESIMVVVAVPGERWEVEFFCDGRGVEIEIFSSNGKIFAGDALEKLFAKHSNGDERD